MRTSDEKLIEIRRREAEMRARKYRRNTLLLSFASAAAAVILVIFAVDAHPKGSSGYEMSARYASVFENSPATGLLLIILVAFALGVCVTLLGMKIRDRSRRGGRR